MIPIHLQPLSNATLPGVSNAGGISRNAPQVPQAVASLPPGSLIKGFVLNRAAGGQPILRSDFGDFLIQSKVFLRIGSEVTIRVQAAGTNFRADIIEVDGKPANADTQGKAGQHSLATDSRSASWQARQDVIQSSQPLPNVDAAGNVKGNFTFTSVLLNPSPDVTKNFGLREGTALILKLFNLQLPTQSSSASTTQATPQTATPPPQTAGATTAQSPTPAAAAPSDSATPATPGAIKAVEGLPTQTPGTPQTPAPASSAQAGKAAHSYQQLQPNQTPQAPTQAATPTGQPAAAATGSAAAQHIHTLTVIGHESDGEPVLQTPFGLAKITSRANLPLGSVLQAQVSLDTEAAENPLLVPTSGAASSSPTSLFRLAHQWPALEQIMQFLKSDPSDPHATLPALPQLTTTNAGGAQVQQVQSAPFSGGLFMFLAALKSGDFRNFLGEKTIQKLQQAGQTSLLSQASAEFGQLARLADNQTGNWQTMFFPVMVDGEVEMVRWFNKQDQSSGEERENDSQTKRFIVEVSTSALGDLQLDGLFRASSERKQLDLVLRSHTPLEQEAQSDILGIIRDLSDATGVQGSILFQTLPHFPEMPLEGALKDIPDVLA